MRGGQETITIGAMLDEQMQTAAWTTITVLVWLIIVLVSVHVTPSPYGGRDPQDPRHTPRFNQPVGAEPVESLQGLSATRRAIRYSGTPNPLASGMTPTN